MASVSTLRDRLKANLQTITDFANRAYDTVPDTFAAPAAIVGYPERIEYGHQLGGNRKAIYTFPVRVYAASLSDRAVQDKLDGYLASSGASSVTVALESDRTLNGNADTVRVRMIRDYGAYNVGTGQFLGAEWVVEVIA